AMVLGLARRKDVDDADAVDEQRIRQEGAMAFPRHRFGAHDRGPPLRGDRDEQIQTRREFGGCYVVGVSSESAVTPAEVHAPRAWPPETPKGQGVSHADP